MQHSKLEIFNSFFNERLNNGEVVEPKINYYKNKFKNVAGDDIELIATSAYNTLIKKGIEFNLSYFQKMVNSRILDHIRNNKVIIKREQRDIAVYEINHRETNEPIIKWKKKLTKDEKKMVFLLKKGLTQREISKLGFNSNKQTALRASIKQKLVVL